jgi:phosphopentomutase
VRNRFVILVADSAGCGELPDSAEYGDQGSNTIGNISRAVGGLSLPTMGRMGLGHLTPIAGVPPDPSPAGFYGKMAERSPGKDTTTGHWEMMGVVLSEPFALFPHGFPPEVIDPWLETIGVPGLLGNVAASGTEIIKQLGEEHQRTGKPIVYTSADSVFQIACHEETIPLERLYEWCAIARKMLDARRVSRVIARPFVGRPGAYQRTYNRRDFSLAAPEPTVLDRLRERAVRVIGIGKIGDIYDHKGLSEEIHTAGNGDGLVKIEEALDRIDGGLLFANLVDFDMLYGHRNEVTGYAHALEELDRALPRILAKLEEGDLFVLTADHGCDPTTLSTDHSREYVPLLAHAPGKGGGSLGIRSSFSDLGATVAEFFGLPPVTGQSFLGEITALQ